jgi:hypothetical protein
LLCGEARCPGDEDEDEGDQAHHPVILASFPGPGSCGNVVGQEAHSCDARPWFW